MIKIENWSLTELKNLAIEWSDSDLLKNYLIQNSGNKSGLLDLIVEEKKLWKNQPEEKETCPGCGEPECNLTCNAGIQLLEFTRDAEWAINTYLMNNPHIEDISDEKIKEFENKELKSTYKDSVNE